MIGLAAIGGLGGQGFVEEFALILLIFFVVLPLINGGVDWGSWWVTRRLGEHLLAALERQTGAVQVGLVALGHGVADLLVAAAMLLAMAFTLAFGFEVYNQAALWTGPQGAFDLEAHVASAAAAPFSEGARLTLMLATTLLPSFLHGVVIWLCPLGFLFLAAKRRVWATDLEQWDALEDTARSRTRRGVAAWMAYWRAGLWLLAALLTVCFFALMAGAVALLHEGGFAGYVAKAAMLGIDAARWLGGAR